jgi:hypothetical protein
MTQLEQNRYEVALARYGMTSESLMRLAERVAIAGLRRRGAVLGDRFEDLVSRLTIVGLNEAVTYDPNHARTRYGQNGGNAFVEWCSDVMERRIDDYFRSRAEGFSDRRYKNYGEVLPTEQVDMDVEQHAVEDAIERLDSLENLQWYQQAAAVEGLSLQHWIIRALNERASRYVQRPSSVRARRVVVEPGPDHWPGQAVVA